MVPGGSKLSPGSSYTDMICTRDLFSYWAAMTVQNAIGGDLTQATRNAEGRDIEFVMDVRTAWQFGQLFDRLFNAELPKFLGSFPCKEICSQCLQYSKRLWSDFNG